MTRIKRVFTGAKDVIHLFAQKSQDRANCQNVFFEPTGQNFDNRSGNKWQKKQEFGTKLYSYGYHYLLAEFLDDNTVMINDKGYSPTTAKHINIARYALSQYKRFYLTNCDIDYVHSVIKSDIASLASARKPELYVNSILHVWEELNKFLVWSKGITKAKKNAKYREMVRIIERINVPDYQDKLKAIKKAEQGRIAKKLKKAIKDFETYEISSIRIGNKEDYLRLSESGQYVETSQGVRVPTREAKILYDMICAGKDVKGYRINGFTVTSLNGTLTIGCHNINIESVHKVGKQLV